MHSWLALAISTLSAVVPMTTVPTSPTAHVRPQGSTAAAWMQAALDQSPTVRELAGRVEASDVIVYIDVTPVPERGTAACVTWMAATPTRRILRVTLDRSLRSSERVAMLAHELQHIVEVIEHPEVRSSDGLIALYSRIGHSTASFRPRFDTLAALRMGDQARTEALNAVPGPGRRSLGD